MQFVGLDFLGDVVSGGDTSVGSVVIAIIDNSGCVYLETSSAVNSFKVTNSCPQTYTCYVTWTGFGTAILAPTNTALGTSALGDYIANNYTGTGKDNTATGFGAMFENSNGSYNTATGYFALRTNQSGSHNTATGYQALYLNESGSDNTAMGHDALENMTVGDTTAIGAFALAANTTGTYNTALGNNALQANSSGASNTAVGYWALQANTGNNNTANGYQALLTNSTGSNNIAVGYQAGSEVTTGSNNIEIGSKGAATDGKLIRIGTEGIQDGTFIAGIYNVPLSGNTVVVNSNGRLGVAAVSSERFKTAIAPMGSETAKLEQLRPVTFKLKTDAKGTRQYGLIAEEVAKVYPELVIRDDNGRIDGVRYDELAPMLLNEMQKQQTTIKAQADKADAQAVEFRAMKEQLAELKQMNESMRAALLKLQAKDQLVAQR